MWKRGATWIVSFGLGLMLGGCSGGPVAPTEVTPTLAQTTRVVIAGFPTTQSLRVGDNALLFLQPATDIAGAEWVTGDPSVAAVTATPAVSPCGRNCAWLKGTGPGRTMVEARVCFRDGSCATANTASLCRADPVGCQEVVPELTVVR
jgi:hypothetical protein